MKRILSILLLATIAISGCKKNNDNSPSDEDALAVFELTSLTADARSTFLEIAPQVGGDPKLALMQTLGWVQQQPGVSDAFHLDSVYLFIEMSNGLQSMFWFKELAADGASKYRGGGSGTLKAITAASGCENIVGNKNVLIYAPGYDEFLYPLKSQVPTRLANSSHIEQVSVLQNEQATVDMISTFSNYGLVLMETHGVANAFLTGDGFILGQAELPTDYTQFHDAVVAQIGQTNFNRLLNGKLIVGGEVVYDPLDPQWWENNQGAFETGNFRLWATARLVAEMPSLSNTIVIGNYCYSGWTTLHEKIPEPIGKAFTDKNPITYYAYAKENGWSLSVDNDESMVMEDTIVSGLVKDDEHTGIAHLKSDGSPFEVTWPGLFLVHLGQPNWCYDACGAEPVTHQGETYNTVCIGDQIWMAENLRHLPAQHTDQQFADAADNETPGYGAYPGEDIQVFGALYNWYAAMDNICPAGWHLPSVEEWQQMAEFTGLLSEAGAKLKSQNYWNAPSFSTDEYGFSAVGGGERGDFLGDFREIGVHGFYWTSTDVGPGIAKAAGFTYNANSFQSGNTSKGAGKSCRCVKDE